MHMRVGLCCGSQNEGDQQDEDDMTLDFTEIGWGCMDRNHMAQNMAPWRVLVNTVMNLRVPQNIGNFLKS